MKLLGLMILVFLSLNAGAQVRMGDWSGSGGDGYAFVFTNLGYRIHREIIMEEYDPNNMQARDEINMARFLFAVDNVKVIVTSENVVDKHGHDQTAKYYTPDELRKIYKAKGLSSVEIEKKIADFPAGLIVVQDQRFQRELNTNLGIALATVFHEYVRALGLDDDNYRTTASRYDYEFFREVQAKASRASQKVFAEAKQGNTLALSKIEMIDKEKMRLKSEIKEDSAELMKVRIERRPYVDAARKSFTKMVDAYAEVLRTISIVPMPFPSAHANTLSAMGKTQSENMDLQQKLSELEVLNIQSRFLAGNLERNTEFYAKIDLVRQELFLGMVKP